jgi:S-adenosylmethionine:tRNA ribosyltransferase-isomerase
METSAFDYELPESAIAQHPLAERDAARLLVDQGTEVAPLNRNVRDLAELLEPGDLLVLNTTRVLPARLALCKETGAAVEVLLLERLDGGSLSDSGTSRWEALVRPGRKLPPGTVVRPVEGTGLEVVIEDDLGDFGMSSLLTANSFIARVLGVTTRITTNYIDNSLELGERRV